MGLKKCPFCAEAIQDEAVKCRHCGSMLDEGARTPGPSDTLDGVGTLLAGQLRPAKVLAGQYEILDAGPVGRGGMSEVWRAHDRELGVPVAIKVLGPALARDAAAVENLRREARIGSRLTHPNISRLYGLHSDGDLRFIVMEYVEGETLAARLAGRPDHRLSWAELEPLARQVAEALDYAHGVTYKDASGRSVEGVLHRDIKPANIMVTAEGVAKVMDFGIAREIHDTTTVVTGHSSQTPPYASPEQFRGEPMTVASDIYSFAAVLYECLAGRPYISPHGDLRYQILEKPYEPLVGGPEGLNAALAWGLSKEVSKRPAKARDLVVRCAAAGREEKRRVPVAEPEAAVAGKGRAGPEAAGKAVSVPRAPQGAAPAAVLREGARGSIKPAPARRRTVWKVLLLTLAVGAILLLVLVGGGFYYAWQRSGLALVIEPGPRPGYVDEAGLWVPVGYLAKAGTTAEQYAGKGWAKEVVHEATGTELAFIPAGEFPMGSPPREKDRGDDETQHVVTLTKPFYLGKHEVTQGEWQKVMGSNPSYFTGEDRLPVEQVSWDDCQAFLRKAGDGLRLPTEAEWEYACRAGTTTPFWTGETISTAEANYNGNYVYGNGTKGAYREKTVDVGSFMPNMCGLYDMHGNVWEWCADWYGDYPSGSVTDPMGPSSGASHVLRGGSWDIFPSYCRSADRDWGTSGSRSIVVGFRVALDLE